MPIVEASGSELEDALAVSRVALGGEDAPALVRDLVADPSAHPLLSLIALDGGRTIGHALFSAARVDAEGDSASAVILGPLAVVPDVQGKGVGGLLLQAGLRLLGESGIGLVLLAGDPRYYDRHGFEPAHRHGFADDAVRSRFAATGAAALRPAGLWIDISGSSDNGDSPERVRDLGLPRLTVADMALAIEPHFETVEIRADVFRHTPDADFRAFVGVFRRRQRRPTVRV